VKIEGALQTPDGAWRVEIVKRGRTRWYRIVHADNEIDWLSITAVERVLGEAGVDMADLVEAPLTVETAPAPGKRASGAA
jgi:bifunctional non-homologous end joining protein LigD